MGLLQVFAVLTAVLQVISEPAESPCLPPLNQPVEGSLAMVRESENRASHGGQRVASVLMIMHDYSDTMTLSMDSFTHVPNNKQ